MKVILDCDPGVDDALAILYLLKKAGRDVIGITTTAGNTSARCAFRNARFVVEKAGVNVPVIPGRGLTLSRGVPTAEFVHGRGGLGLFFENEGHPQQDESDEAPHFIISSIENYQSELLIIATAPLTNLARAELKKPGILKKTGRIVWMGGAEGKGNVTPHAEFNAYFDPESAGVVFQSGARITMVPLDITEKVEVGEEEFFSQIKDEDDFFRRLLSRYVEFHEKKYKRRALFLHDPVAVGVALDATEVWKESVKADIIKEGEQRGKTLFKRLEGSSISVVQEIEKNSFIEDFFQQLSK